MAKVFTNRLPSFVYFRQTGWRLSAPSSGSARRRARERRRAEQTRAEGERLARERREQCARERVELQRQNESTGVNDGYEMSETGDRSMPILKRECDTVRAGYPQAREELASYEPWGRAGGGAPNARGVRFTNLRDTGIFPEDELRGVSQHEAFLRFSTPRRRRLTPLRLREDPQLCFTDNLRQSIENEIRYKQTSDQQQSYRHILDDMVDKRNKAIKNEIKEKLDYERKMHTMDSPWGKPGPGGAIWRNPRNVGLNFSKSMGWTDNEIFTKLQGDQKVNKRSSLTLPKVKKDDDIKDQDAEKENIEKPPNVEKLPDIKQTNSVNGNVNANSPQPIQSTEEKEVNGNSKSNGKRSPKKNKFIKRLSNGDRVRKVIPEDFLNATSIVNSENVLNGLEKKLTPETTILRVTGGVELVPLLARRRRVGARTLPSSDVTRPPDQSCQWREIDVQYLRDLKNQMRVKNEQIEEKRRDSAESVRRHHETWESLWGRPGHGAPQRGRYARSNLAQLLYVVPLANAQ